MFEWMYYINSAITYVFGELPYNENYLIFYGRLAVFVLLLIFLSFSVRKLFPDQDNVALIISVLFSVGGAFLMPEYYIMFILTGYSTLYAMILLLVPIILALWFGWKYARTRMHYAFAIAFLVIVWFVFPSVINGLNVNESFYGWFNVIFLVLVGYLVFKIIFFKPRSYNTFRY